MSGASLLHSANLIVEICRVGEYLTIKYRKISQDTADYCISIVSYINLQPFLLMVDTSVPEVSKDTEDTALHVSYLGYSLKVFSPTL